MAATHSSESQGLMIALIVFVLLFIGAGVAAYVFYDQTDRLKQEATGAREEAGKARAAELQAKKNYVALRETVYGTMTEEDHEKVMQLIKDDLTKPRIGERLANMPQYKSFKTALDYVQDEIGAADKRVTEQVEQIAGLQKQIEALKEQYQQQVTVAETDRDTKAKELEEQTQKFNVGLARADQETRNTEDQYRKTLNQLRDLEQTSEKDKQRYENEIKDLARKIDELTYRSALADQLEFVSADGAITEITRFEGNTVVYMDVGAEDGLVKGTTFGIYGRDEGGNPYKFPKANVEVTRILGPHRALGRMSTTQPDETVLPGDLLYNPLWDRGSRVGIAVVGNVFMDDDDEPDNDEFLRMVKALGVDVDAVFDLKDLKLKGKIDVNTKWLVIGEVPEERENAPQEEKDLIIKLKGASTELRGQARTNGVRVINVRNLLTYMGKQQPQRTVLAGQERIYLYGKKRPGLIDKGPEPAVKPDAGSGNGNGR